MTAVKYSRDNAGLTHQRLLECMNYCEHDGVFRWAINTNSRKGGEVAGYLKSGYRYIKIDGTQYMGHRLAWLYMTGDWPNGEVDHVNTARSDNRWKNLRIASAAQQAANRSKPTNNTTGYKGVGKVGERFYARIGKGGRHYHLGTFDCPIEAHNAYIVAAKEMFGEFARAE